MTLQPSLSGTVTQDGNPLPGVKMTATSPSLEGSRTTVSGEAGGYNFQAIPPGTYTIQFALEGFSTVTKKIQLAAGQNGTLNADLMAGPGNE